MKALGYYGLDPIIPRTAVGTAAEVDAAVSFANNSTDPVPAGARDEELLMLASHQRATGSDVVSTRPGVFAHAVVTLAPRCIRAHGAV
ncbi:MAG: hypothetical protein JWM76_192 [Pseudonocardiales bacterium]|nr:hypothetical protein [Pseudonocardiales bacterium]